MKSTGIFVKTRRKISISFRKYVFWYSYFYSDVIKQSLNWTTALLYENLSSKLIIFLDSILMGPNREKTTAQQICSPKVNPGHIILVSVLDTLQHVCFSVLKCGHLGSFADCVEKREFYCQTKKFDDYMLGYNKTQQPHLAASFFPFLVQRHFIPTMSFGPPLPLFQC